MVSSEHAAVCAAVDEADECSTFILVLALASRTAACRSHCHAMQAVTSRSLMLPLPLVLLPPLLAPLHILQHSVGVSPGEVAATVKREEDEVEEVDGDSGSSRKPAARMQGVLCKRSFPSSKLTCALAVASSASDATACSSERKVALSHSATETDGLASRITTDE